MSFDSFKEGVEGWAKDIRGIHESFKGNSAYDSLIEDLEQIQWQNIEPENIKGVATGIGKTATKHGIEVGRNFLMSFLKMADPTGGVLVTGAEMVLDWGSEMLYSNMWGESLNYDLGDLVIVLKDSVPPKDELRRRRLPANETLDVGVVTGRPSEGRVEVTLMPGARTKSVSTHSVKKVDDEIAKNVPGLNNFRRSFQAVEQATGGIPAGAFVKYEEQIMNVVGYRDGKVLLEGWDLGENQTFEVDESKVELVFQKSWGKIYQGQIAWKEYTGQLLKGYKWEAVMIKEVNPTSGMILCFSMYDGKDYLMPWHKLKSSRMNARLYPEFMMAIAQPWPAEKRARSMFLQRVHNATKKSGVTEVIRKELANYCEPLGERPYGAVYSIPSKKKPVKTTAQRRDDYRDDADGRRVPVERPVVETKEKDSNTTVLIIGAAGIILFLLFKK